MKRIAIVIIFVALLSVGLAIAGSKGGKKDSNNKNKIEMIGSDSFVPDSTAKANLGSLASRVIYSAEKINVYSLAGYDTIPEGKTEVLPHYARERLVGTLDVRYADILKFLLFNNAESYALDSIPVRSPRIPTIELEYLTKKKEAVSVVFSFTDFVWMVKSDGKVQFTWNFQNKELIERFFIPIEKAKDITRVDDAQK